MTPREMLSLSVLIVLVLLALACGGPAQEPVRSAANDEPLAEPLPPVKLSSVSTRFPAFASSLREDPSWGFELAIREANDAGGVLGGREVVGVTYSQGYYASTVVGAAKRALDQGAVAIVGGGADPICVPLKNMLRDKGRVPVAITNCGAEEVTLQGYRGVAHMRSPVSAAQSPNNMLAAEARWMLSHGKRLALLGLDLPYCATVEREFRRVIAEEAPLDFELIDVIHLPQFAMEYRTEVIKAVGGSPDLLYLCLWGREHVVRAIKTAKAKGFDGPIIVTTFTEDEALALGPEFSKNVYGSADWFVDVDEPESVRFVDAIKAHYSGDFEPTWLTENYYVGAKLLIAAIQQAGSTDRQAIGDAMHQVSFVTPDGSRLALASNGQRLKPYTVLTEAGADGKMRLAERMFLRSDAGSR